MAQTIHERREQFHSLRLNEHLDRSTPPSRSYINQSYPGYLQQTGDPALSQQLALQTLANLRLQQSSALAYFDSFFVFACVAGVLVFLVFLMKRAVAEKGAHVAAE